MAKKKFSFFGKKEEKEKIIYEVKDQVKPDSADEKRIEKLDKEMQKKLDQTKRPVNEHEEIDLVTGQVYKTETKTEEPRVKEKGVPWTPGLFKNKEVESKEIAPKEVTPKGIAPLPIKKKKIESSLLIVCIEISYPIEKIEVLLNAVFNMKETFVKFVFFSDKIYQTDLFFFNKISKEKILKLIKEQKDFQSGDNVLLYDAVDESLQISKENIFLQKRKYVIGNNEYVIEENKYVFIFSGEEKGSSIKKNELQSVIRDVRQREASLTLFLTNPKNLLSISTLGFRWVKTVNIDNI